MSPPPWPVRVVWLWLFVVLSCGALAPFIANDVPLLHLAAAGSGLGRVQWPAFAERSPAGMAGALLGSVGVAMLCLARAPSPRRLAWLCLGAACILSAADAPRPGPPPDSSGLSVWPLIRYAPDGVDLDAVLLRPDIGGPHVLGTDALGRDTLALAIWGARTSLSVAATATACAFVLGVLLGGAAELGGAAARFVAERLIEATRSIPGLFLVMAITTVAGPGLATTVLFISLVTWPGIARQVASAVELARRSGYVEAARAAGYSRQRILFAEILPNLDATLRVGFLYAFMSAVAIEGAVAFLGFGVAVPTTSWGAQIAAGRRYLHTNPELTLLPTLGMASLLLSLALLHPGRSGSGRS